MKLPLGIVAAAAVCSAQTQPTVTTLSGGHIWLENLGFSSARGGLFFSDAFTGEIFKVNATYVNGAWSYNVSTFISGLDMFGALGFASAPSGLMYSSAVKGGVNGIIAYDPRQPGAYDMIATAADMNGGYLINGVALDTDTNTLLATSLGHLTPGEGEVVSASAQGGPLTTWSASANGLNGSDGLWLDEAARLAYVGELTTATVLVYNLDTGALLRSFVAPGMQQLDDFTLDPTGQWIYGADIMAGAIVKFAANGTGTGTPVVTGLVNCTSARFGGALGFNPLSLFVTEGGGQGAAQATRRLLEVDFSATEEGAWLRQQYAAVGKRV